MRRILKSFIILFTLLLALASLPACQSAKNTAPGSSEKQTLPHLAFPKIEKVDVSLPAPIPEYHPKSSILPLISTPHIYRRNLMGELIFINENKERISLPDQASSYFGLSHLAPGQYDQPAPLPKGVVLAGESGMALMHLDGKVVTDFLYTAPDVSDWIIVNAHENYVLLEKDTGVHNHYGRTGRLGLVDIRTGKEVVPFIYDNLSFIDGFLYAQKLDEKGNEHNMLLDYQGNLLYDMESLVFERTFNGDLAFSGDGFYYDLEKRELYRITTDPDVYFRKFGGDLSMMTFFDESIGREKVTVYDLKGKPVASQYCDRFFWDDGIPILQDGEELIAFDPEGTKSVFLSQDKQRTGRCTYLCPSPDTSDSPDTLDSPDVSDITDTANNSDEDNRRIISVSYSRESGTFSVILESNSNLEIPLDKDGILQESQAKEVFHQYGNIFYYFARDTYALMDKKGKELIPAGKYPRLYELGSFVIACTASEDDPKVTYDIYTKGGRLLLSSAYGLVLDLVTEDSMVVYKTPNSCGILHPDGSFDPVPGVPAVKAEYAGG